MFFSTTSSLIQRQNLALLGYLTTFYSNASLLIFSEMKTRIFRQSIKPICRVVKVLCRHLLLAARGLLLLHRHLRLQTTVRLQLYPTRRLCRESRHTSRPAANRPHLLYHRHLPSARRRCIVHQLRARRHCRERRHRYRRMSLRLATNRLRLHYRHHHLRHRCNVHRH